MSEKVDRLTPKMLGGQRRHGMKTDMRPRLERICVCCLFALAIAGCAGGPKSSGPEALQKPTAQVCPQLEEETLSQELKATEMKEVRPPDYYIHTVRWHGETLSYIAKWYTGQFRNWKVLAKANPNLNPNRIHKGNQIIIPDGMLKTREPMPKSFMAKLTPQTTNRKIPDKPSSQPEEGKAIPLFGPKEHTGN